MKRLGHVILFFTIVLGLGALGVLWLQSNERAVASAPPIASAPQPPAPAPEAPPVDPRVASLTDRGDGARLLWAAPAGMAILRAGFADNGTLIVSATTSSLSRVFALDVVSASATMQMSGAVDRVASDHRPTNINARKFCWSERAAGKFDVFCADDAWRNPKRLTTHDGDEDLINPALSPDGEWVVFEVNDDRANGQRKKPGMSSVWKIGVNGAGLQQLTRGADDRFPTWSEDGTRIYFQRRFSDGNWDMMSMAADGSNPLPVLSTPYDDERWPTRVAGTSDVAVSAGPSGGPGRLRVIDTITKAGDWLTSEAFGPVTDVSLSPDGKLASFLSPLPDDPSRFGIWLRPIETP